MERSGILFLSLLILLYCRESSAKSGSFGDDGLYKVVIEKARVPNQKDDVLVRYYFVEILSFFYDHNRRFCRRNDRKATCKPL